MSGASEKNFPLRTFTEGTRWENQEQEVERPDVLSQAAFTLVASTENSTATDEWHPRPSWATYGSLDLREGSNYCSNEPGQHGTSFAAPTVAGLLALLHECRERNNAGVSPVLDRAIVRTSALWGQDLLGLPIPISYESSSGLRSVAYPIPGTHQDASTGTGIADAERMAMFCHDGSMDVGNDGTYDVEVGVHEGSDLGSGWLTTPPEIQNLKLNEVGENSINISSTYKDPIFLTNLVDTQLRVLNEFEKIKAGSRIRYSLSFLNCGEITYPEPSIDFDLLACYESGSTLKCFGSTSRFDTNEGFDVILDEDIEKLTVYIVKQRGAQSQCSGGPNDPLKADEPYGTAYIFWWK